ncbi:MAG: thermonuclease family protein [Candidatus Omnitrophica bacterium]|nr:thermonuclease family protein [Candidatus Omnitrophota bacterium]
MPLTALKSKSSSLQTYSSLKSAVRAEFALGRERAFQAVEREKVRTAWNVGKLILDHVLLNRKKGDYGGNVLRRLSKDLELSITELRYMVEFARTYPNLQPAGDLPWSSYTSLLAVNDAKTRKKLITEAVANDWTRKELRTAIKKVKAGSPIKTFGDDSVGSLGDDNAGKDGLRKNPKLGKPGVYRTVKWNDEDAYDLGFSTYMKIKGRKKKRAQPKPSELYFYEAVVDRVVDGDTLWVNVNLGFGVGSYQKLRLRGLDAPELSSRAGQQAKRFVEKELKKAKTIMLRTSKSDKYDRYLADVWADEVYLNGLLIDRGFALNIA